MAFPLGSPTSATILHFRASRHPGSPRRAPVHPSQLHPGDFLGCIAVTRFVDSRFRGNDNRGREPAAGHLIKPRCNSVIRVSRPSRQDSVIPAKAGIQELRDEPNSMTRIRVWIGRGRGSTPWDVSQSPGLWIPASAGMTIRGAGPHIANGLLRGNASPFSQTHGTAP